MKKDFTFNNIDILKIVKKGISNEEWNTLDEEDKNDRIDDFLSLTETNSKNEDGTYNVMFNQKHFDVEEHKYNEDEFICIDFYSEMNLLIKNGEPIFITSVYEWHGSYFDKSMLLIYGHEEIVAYNLINGDLIITHTR